MKRFVFLLAFLAIWCSSLIAQIQLRITEIPNNTPPGDTIFVVGSFNNWNPADPGYQLIKDNAGVYQVTINPPAGMVEYKFTRGDWDRVEGNATGGYRPNRTYNYDGNATSLSLQILSWEGSNTNSTAAANVSVINDAFYMPQLNRYRKIWLYLPPDYNSSAKKYPVLYMHDGQNLFDQATSFGQEWQVDESLNSLFAQGDYGVIVVGIDNGGADRLPEYTPWSHPTYGGGEGDAYIDFIVETLKPYIDQNYRTLPQQEFTGIMGSSLGGLVSTYGIIEHQEVFGKAGCFSSSFWLYNYPYEHVTNTGKKADLKIYMIAGQQESTDIDVVADMYRMEQTMENAGFPDEQIKAVDHADGQHSEWYWAREFPAAYKWLFGDLQIPTALEGINISHQVIIYPNPGQEYLLVELEEIQPDIQLELYDLQGNLIRQTVLPQLQNRLVIQNLSAGTYWIQLRKKGQAIYSQQWVKIK